MRHTDLTAARVLADSVSPTGARIVTVEATFPRIILAEFNTHRALSRNSASSRAIPVAKQLERVLEHPFVPQRFGVNRPGMSATEYHKPGSPGYETAARSWLNARDECAEWAQDLADQHIHKQTVNRLIEPWMWHTAIATGNVESWEGFFGLRIAPDAQPEIRTAAEAIQSAIGASVPRSLDYRQWHLPLVGTECGDPDPNDEDDPLSPTEWAMVSSARCGRVSYLTHDGRRDIGEDLAMSLRLIGPRHLSPFEHAAHPTDPDALPGAEANLRGWTQLRRYVELGYLDTYTQEALAAR